MYRRLLSFIFALFLTASVGVSAYAASTDTSESGSRAESAVRRVRSTVANGATGNTIYVKLPCTVTVIPAGGASGKLQFSTSLYGDLDAGTATWQDWNAGTVTAATSAVLPGWVTAVRVVSVSGAVTLEVVQ